MNPKRVEVHVAGRSGTTELLQETSDSDDSGGGDRKDGTCPFS